MNNTTLQPPDKNEVSWRTRARAWIFGMDVEALLGIHVADITDGESYIVHRVFPAGIEVPDGEHEKAQRMAQDATEFHLGVEMTMDDLRNDVRLTNGRGVLASHAFWMESTGKVGSDGWRVCYVMRSGTSAVEILCLRDRLGKPSRAKLMVTKKSYRMKVMREEIEKDL